MSHIQRILAKQENIQSAHFIKYLVNTGSFFLKSSNALNDQRREKKLPLLVSSGERAVNESERSALVSC